MSNRRAYPRNQSRLYKIKSPAQLADVLNIKKHQLESLAKYSNENYHRWTDEASGRAIQRPKPMLEKIHIRAAQLLGRIETPEFLHSAVKGRSYISNAEQHVFGQPTVKADIRRFYPSTRAPAVFHFFQDRMHCVGDVSGILAQLLTVDGHLATGSSVSPILSFFAYEDMFDEIENLALRYECGMTCYVDDMVFTGPGARRQLIYDLIKVVRRYQLLVHKTKIFRAQQPKVVTGIAMTQRGKRLPNRRQHAISQRFKELKSARTDLERLRIMEKLIGQLFEAAQVDSTWYPRALQMRDERRALQRSISQRSQIIN
ncbi:MAG: reverse transcriptase family protein [Gammaproteobacteria bacterium]|nr:reverse transcriptase family protein [Gammaproteobacteria bacterium]